MTMRKKKRNVKIERARGLEMTRRDTVVFLIGGVWYYCNF
jgi:hypothetical protein